MRKIFVLLIIMLIPCHCFSDTTYKPLFKQQRIVTSTKKIHIPDYPKAYNPSILKFQDGYMLTFRYQPNIHTQWWVSYIGVVLLDKTFEPISQPQLLDTRFNDKRTHSQSEDARIFSANGKLYVIYNDNMELENPNTWERRDIYLAELSYVNGDFVVSDPVKLVYPEKYRHIPWQKNWVPFDWNGTLFLSYTINPHEVICPDISTGSCVKCYETQKSIHWPLGPIRGGTPALLVDGEYLAFFHSGIYHPSACSDNRPLWHYYMGAYTFAAEPPFEVTKISHTPIEAPGFYTNSNCIKRVIYPTGFIADGSKIYLAYGKDDQEICIATIDLIELKKSMASVKKENQQQQRPK